MFRVQPLSVGDYTAIAFEAKLPKTTLLVVMTQTGYIMCGALDVELLNDRLQDRKIIAGRAVGVRTIEELLEAPLESVTFEAEKYGIRIGMKGSEAIQLLLKREAAQE